MNEIECPGLPADWLNAWLAALGLLVLEPRLRLSWTSDASPIAVLAVDGDTEPLAMAVNSWPQLERLTAMPIARRIEHIHDMQRNVPLDVFRERAEIARSHDDAWTLSSSITDLYVDPSDGTARHSDLDPPAPRGTTLHDRLIKCFREVRSPSQAIPASLRGYGTRVKANGLGFDASRIAGLADSSTKLVDPVIEVLAFFGLRILPMRGAGRAISGTGRQSASWARQRCWQLNSESPYEMQMAWPTWTRPLDISGVDALLDIWAELVSRDRWTPAGLKALSRLTIYAAWHTRRYQRRGSNDVTRGFVSARMELDARRR